MEKTIIEGNKLIAEFLQFDYSDAPSDGTCNSDESYLKYHSSWDCLMPVVEKIEALDDLIVNKVWVSINGNSCGMWTYFDPKDVLRIGTENNSFKIKHVSKEGKLKATWLAVIAFIEWYNNQNK